jgi:hypothetical protein
LLKNGSDVSQHIRDSDEVLLLPHLCLVEVVQDFEQSKELSTKRFFVVLEHHFTRL